MKRVYITTAVTAALAVLCFSFLYSYWSPKTEIDLLRIGFIYENDDSTPYTHNFALSERVLRETYGDRIEILSKSNVLRTEAEDPVRELIRNGCTLIFTNSHSEVFLELAPKFPDVLFCQVSCLNRRPDKLPENYHTFNGEIHEGRYVSGIAAGMKLRELIDSGRISPSEALVGFIGSYPSAPVTSAFTAFLLGVRSVAPEAVMKVRYTHTLGSYSREKECAEELIDEGCVLLSHYTDTIGPAIACEEASGDRKVFFIGYNESMLDEAPSTTLISTRVNWIPYITGAVEAVFAGETIEKHVEGHDHGQDISAGFSRDWVEMLVLNDSIAADNTEKKMQEAIDALKKGSLKVFKGDYTGTDPDDSSDRIDLSEGYTENADSSLPSFHYILDGIIEVEN